ncbi:MAG: hypothetical protein A2Z20_04455 [Bdellovibrionales bacterium RBG_16_40_8]|nr:MAG: hypothetical protein A2Z20_04455 [Bdellovibrionales bacterium RBG_16_40_8]
MRDSNNIVAAPDVTVGLVHWPCLNQHGEVVCTNVTNFDIHDIARSCRTYGVNQYFIINRVKEQLMFVERVLDHWRVGEGSDHNPRRKTAIRMVKTAETLEDSLKDFKVKPLLIATSAQNRVDYQNISFGHLRERMWFERSQPTYLVFGTGWGFTDDVIKQCDFVLDPIKGSSADDFRHLSVRAAAAICLDRLLGQ